MILITTLVKNTLTLNCYLLTQTVLRMKSNQKMFMKNFLSTSICLTLEIAQKTQKFYDNQNEMVIGKMKVENKGISINKFVGLKPKMYSMLSDDGKESNTAKEVKIATDFNEFRDILFNKRIVRHEMKRIKVKNTNLENMKSTKYHYHVLMIKDLF